MMVGTKPRENVEISPTTDNVEIAPMTEKDKTFGTVFAVATEDIRDEDHADPLATASHEETVENGTTNQQKTSLLELSDLMAKLEQIDRQLKCSEEDRQLLEKEIRYNKHESLDHCFNLARATEERLQQMSDKVEATTRRERSSSKKTCKN